MANDGSGAEGEEEGRERGGGVVGSTGRVADVTGEVRVDAMLEGYRCEGWEDSGPAVVLLSMSPS